MLGAFAPKRPKSIFMSKRYTIKWLYILLLSNYRNFLESYIYSSDFDSHNYTFYRKLNAKDIDCFVVVRTSLKCYRVMYSNTLYKIYLYRSFCSAGEVAMFLYDTYCKYKV